MYHWLCLSEAVVQSKMGQCVSKQQAPTYQCKVQLHVEPVRTGSPMLGLKSAMKKGNSNSLLSSDNALCASRDSILSSRTSLVDNRVPSDSQLKKKVSFDLMAELVSILPSIDNQEANDSTAAAAAADNDVDVDVEVEVDVDVVAEVADKVGSHGGSSEGSVVKMAAIA